MLHLWLIPVLVVFLVAVLGFYAVLKHRGGSGIRTPGHTLVDKPVDDQDPPPP